MEKKENKKLTKNNLVHAIVAISDAIMDNLDIIMNDGFPESVGFMVWAIPTSFSLEIVEKYKEQEGAGLYHKRGGMYIRYCSG